MTDKEEVKLRHTLDKALVEVWKQKSKAIQQVRVYIATGEYHLAVTLMTELTTMQADVSMKLRSILIKQGYIESEL
jgi:hypothetical protein